MSHDLFYPVPYLILTSLLEHTDLKSTLISLVVFSRLSDSVFQIIFTSLKGVINMDVS